MNVQSNRIFVLLQTYVDMVKDDMLDNSLKILKQELEFIARGYPQNEYFSRLVIDSIFEVGLAYNRIKTVHLRFTNEYDYIYTHKSKFISIYKHS